MKGQRGSVLHRKVRARRASRHWLRLVGTLLLVLSSLPLTAVGAEIVFRVYKVIRGPQDTPFRVAPAVYGQFDLRFGQHFIPGSQFVVSLVANNKVVGCLGVVESANEDGLGGRSTLRAARAADYVIFTTGDSFTHWKQDDLTVPDVVESLLRERTGVRVANLDFARGAYGLLQMLTIAAETYPVVKPNLIVIQFISDDLTRGRWWTRETSIGGRTLALISARPDGFDDSQITNNEYVVDPRATDAWCHQQLAAPHDDGVARDATKFYRDYLRTRGIAFNPLALTRSYLADSLSMRLLGRPFHTATRYRLIPRVTADEFAADQGYADAVRTLRTVGVPVVFIHLPSKQEIQTGASPLGPDDVRIWKKLETDFGTLVITYAALPEPPAVPLRMDLQPYDGHPNVDGIRFYGDYVAEAIVDRVRPDAAGPITQQRSATISGVPHRTPMQPTLIQEPFHRQGWVQEKKVEDWRLPPSKDRTRARLVGRHGIDHTRQFRDSWRRDHEALRPEPRA